MLSFFKGALLKDAKHILEKPGANTQSARIVKFASMEQVTKLKPTLKAYLREAIEAEKSGLKVDFKEKTTLVFPEELLTKFKEYPSFEKAFMALTPGRQRAYNLYFSAAKQSATRTARIEKCIPQIMEGKGLND